MFGIIGIIGTTAVSVTNTTFINADSAVLTVMGTLLPLLAGITIALKLLRTADYEPTIPYTKETKYEEDTTYPYEIEAPIKNNMWECIYCDSLNKLTTTQCKHCSAPRRIQKIK